MSSAAARPGCFTLTKSHVLSAFAPLAETSDLAARGLFTSFIEPDVTWTIPGKAHSLCGTRHSLQAHNDATFSRLGSLLVAPIRFEVTLVVVDAEPAEDGWWATVELTGAATQKTGEPYDNEYVFLTRWNDEGKIVEVRSYFDTMLSEQVLQNEK